MRRRHLLQLASIGLGAGLAGCADREDGDSSVRVVKISFLNEDDQPHEIDLTLIRDGSVALQEVYSLSQEQRYAAGDTAVIEPPAFDPALGNWTIRIRLDSGEPTREFDPNTLEGKENCVWPTFLIMATGEIAFAESFGFESCPP